MFFASHATTTDYPVTIALDPNFLVSYESFYPSGTLEYTALKTLGVEMRGRYSDGSNRPIACECTFTGKENCTITEFLGAIYLVRPPRVSSIQEHPYFKSFVLQIVADLIMQNKFNLIKQIAVWLQQVSREITSEEQKLRQAALKNVECVLAYQLSLDKSLEARNPTNIKYLYDCDKGGVLSAAFIRGDKSGEATAEITGYWSNQPEHDPYEERGEGSLLVYAAAKSKEKELDPTASLTPEGSRSDESRQKKSLEEESAPLIAEATRSRSPSVASSSSSRGSQSAKKMKAETIRTNCDKLEKHYTKSWEKILRNICIGIGLTLFGVAFFMLLFMLPVGGLITLALAGSTLDKMSIIYAGALVHAVASATTMGAGIVTTIINIEKCGLRHKFDKAEKTPEAFEYPRSATTSHRLSH